MRAIAALLLAFSLGREIAAQLQKWRGAGLLKILKYLA